EEAAYELLGGTLTVGEEMILMGTLDFADGDGALATLEGGVGSFAGGSMLGGQNATITAETGTELFFPAGFNPFADLAYYECLGTTHLYGDTWDIAAGETERASGEVHSHVRCAGRLLPATGADGYTLREGVEVLPGGEVDTGTGALVVVDDVSGIAGSELRTASIVVGTPEAAGTFAQSGGTVTVSDPDVTGGVQVGSRWVFGSTTDPGAVGEYRISDGMLTAPNIAVGFDAQGRFVQTGGTVNVHDCVRIAEASFGGADGVYEMSGGQLNAGNVSVGDNGRFTHSGGHIEADFLLCNGSGSYEMSGTATLHAKTLRGGAALLGPDNAVVLSDSFHASKHCTLAAGSMTTPQVTVSDKGGLLQQSGGMLTTDIFEVQGYGDPSEYATYALAGGVCDVGARFQMDGTWDLADATAAVSWDTIIADISHGDIVNAGSASWTLGPRSLLIVRSGQNPATAFGSFHSTGMIHTRGTDLTIPAGRTIVGAGRIEDRVVCQGELRAENGASLQLVAGVSLDAGTVDLGAEGEAFIETDDCRITGGELRGGTAKILGDFSSNGARVNFDHSGGSMKSNVLAAKAIYNLSGTGRIDNNVTDLRRTDLHQTGGTLETGELHIGGRMSGSNPAIGYHMTHGQIDAETIRVSSVILQTNHGLSGGFAQTGGRVDVNNLYVGGGYGWCGLDEKPGRYELGGDGVLNTANTWVGKYSEGTFVQTGGTHQTQRLSGHTGSCESTYELRAGTLTAASAFFSGNDLFLQTGGLCNVSGRFAVVGQPGSYIQPDRGVVRIEGGLMTAGRMQVGIDGHVAGGLQLLHSEIRVGDLRVGDCQPDAYHPQLASQLRLMSADASMEVANVFKLGRCAAFTTSTWGAAIHMTGSAFENESTDPAAVEGLSKLTLVFEGGGSEVDPFEIASLDMGAGDPDAFEENFALGCLMLGGDAGIGQVLLVDDFDNQQDGADNEVLYVKELVLLEGSSLDLNGHTLYYQTLADAGCSIDLGSGGALTQAVPEPTVLSLVMLGAVGLLRRKRRRGMD
ncbi:MAG: PEP-CTERM sorting domain-containing protein, partial [Phycisphaerae bacterium]|nr:PEP-CTERM sorting domain-containing protein [Phycisphaerae bacterium]